jgi:F-type H+-transporting ATPase subunit a
MKPKTIGLLLAIVALVVVGAIFFKGVLPEVILPSETLFTIGGWGVRNTVVTSWLVIVFLVVMSYLATRKSTIVPVRFLQNFAEAVLEWMYGIVEDAAGAANARRFFPIVGTIFLYVICSNWFGLLPFYSTIGRTVTPEVAAGQTSKAIVYKTYKLGSLPVAIEGLHPKTVEVQEKSGEETTRTDGQPLTDSDQTHTSGTLVPFFRSVFSDANAPLSIAIVSFIAVEYWGLTALGVRTYLGKFFNFKAILSGQPLGIIDVFVGLLELLSEFVRIISFTFRLLGNIFAGEVLIVFMTFLVPFFVPTLFYGLELFVGFIQASVFALLTLVFAIMAVEHHESAEHDAAGHEQFEFEPA